LHCKTKLSLFVFQASAETACHKQCRNRSQFNKVIDNNPRRHDRSPVRRKRVFLPPFSKVDRPGPNLAHQHIYDFDTDIGEIRCTYWSCGTLDF